MDPFRVFEEAGFAAFAVQSALVEGHKGCTVMSRSVTKRLKIAGILDATFA